MRVSLRFTVLILALSLAMTVLSLGTTVPVQAQDEQRYLIIASSGLPPALDMLVASVGGRLVASFESIGVAVAVSSEPMFQAAAWGLPGIQAVVPDAIAAEGLPVGPESFATESFATEFGDTEGVIAEGGPAINCKAAPNPATCAQWNLVTIDAKRAWDYAVGAGIRVAVLDSGIDGGHPGLAGQVLATDEFGRPLSKAFVDEVHTSPTLADALIDRAAHGTHVAGVIAAKSFVPGVAPAAKLISVKVLTWDPAAQAATGPESAVIAGILYATDIGANVINMSLGFTFAVNDRQSAQQLVALNRAVNYAYSRGVLVVASVGNGGTDLDRNRNEVKAPAQIAHVVAVSATGPLFGENLDKLASFSDYGSSTVFVAAPGGNVLVALSAGKPQRINPSTDMVVSVCSRQAAAPELAACRAAPMALRMAGTSQAAAHVSGLAALILSRYGALAPDQVRAIIQRSAEDLDKPGKDQYFGFGRINAYRAVTGK